MKNRIREILSGTSLTEKELDKATKELSDLFNINGTFKVLAINLADFKQIAIGNIETNKVICHMYFDGEDEYDTSLIIANKICDNLNNNS